jgi:hypothetical protein
MWGILKWPRLGDFGWPSGTDLRDGVDDMNDYERFSKQMNDALDALRDTIEKLDVSLAKKDALSGLVRELRVAAYQAGRSEASSGQQRQEKAAGPVFRYMKEFGKTIKMEPQIQHLVLHGLMTDESWHNNAAAHFEHRMSDGNVLLLWIAEENRDDREDELVPRYTVELAGPEGTADARREQLLATESTDEAFMFVRQRIEADLKLGGKIDGPVH